MRLRHLSPAPGRPGVETERTLACSELGFDCPFRSNGTNVGDALTGIMRHIRAVHTLDWFELEELHEAARSLLRKEKGGNPPSP